MALRPVEVRINGDTSGLDRALGRAGRGLRNMAVAGVAAAAAVTTALTAMTVQGLASVDALAKSARAADATANGLRAVHLAAADAGVSTGDATTALQQMNRELTRAAEEGTPAHKALGRLGLAAKDLQNLDADKRIALIADRVQELGLSAGETSDIMRDLGVRSREMALLMIGGGDAIRAAREEVREFGLELTDNQIGAIEDANDAVSRMTLIFEGLRNQLASNVAPVLLEVANRFNEFAQSDAARDAIARITDAFGNLISIVGSDDFLSIALGVFERMISITATLANGLVYLSQNVEVLTTAAAAAAIALAAMGGPITLIVAATALAVGGIALLRNRSGELAIKAQAAADAEAALNVALGTFSDTASPAAARAARDLAAANIDIKNTALAAARAELKKMEMISESDFRVGNPGDGPDAVDVRRDAAAEAVAKLEAELSRLEKLKVRLSQVAAIGGTRPRMRPMDGDDTGTDTDTDTDTEVPIVPGLPGGAGIADQMETRLEALMTGLQTEREALEIWREEGLTLLAESLEAENLTTAEYLEARQRLEEEYARRSNQIEGMRSKNNLVTATAGIGQILGAAAQGNKKLIKGQKIFAAASALIDTYQGAARELRKGTLGFATAAAVIARGFGFIAAINSAGSGGSGGGGGGGTAAAAAAAPAPPPQTQNVMIDLVGATGRQIDQFQAFADTFNEASRQGLMTNVTVRGI